MRDVSEALEFVTFVTFVALGAIAVHQWRRFRSDSAAWLAATFGSLGVVVLISRFLPERSDEALVAWVRRIDIALIALFPYLLWRFAMTFLPVVRWFWVAAHVLTGAVVVGAFLLPEIPPSGEARPALFQAYVYLILFQWVVLSLRVAGRLWAAGKGLPTVSRRRMRTLSTGAVVLSLALIVAGAAPSDESVGVAQIAVQVLAIGSGPFFLLGFSPPGIIRTLWRRPEEDALREAEVSLMGAEHPTDVADVLLPHTARLVGAGSAVLATEEGEVVAAWTGGEPAELPPARRSHLEQTPTMVPLHGGWTITVTPSPFTPFFGREEGELLRTLSLLADLALARVTLLEELARSNEELEQFAYVASHDLQEPLRTVSSYAELLSDRYRGGLDDKADRFIDYVIDGCVRMQQLINDLLAFSRVGTRGGATAPVDVGDAVDKALTNLAGAISDSRADIKIGALPAIEADAAQITQLFQNLIGNSIKYRDPARPPRIEITAERNGGDWIFSVQDNGIGIDPKYADRIFTIFQRLHTRQEYSGTGIGLSICKKIVERHGGRIWLEPNGREGALFRFSLPAGRKDGHESRRR